MPKRWGVRRAVLVFGGFYFFARFVGRNNPLKPACFCHGGEEKTRIAGKDWQGGSEKISGSGRVGFLRFTFLNLFRHFVQAGIRRAQTSDALGVLLNQAEERDILEIAGNANFDNRFRLTLFWRIKLGEARSQNMGLQKIPSGSCGILLHLIFDEPNFGPVVAWRITEQNNLKEWFVRFELDRMMELGNEGAKFFEEGDADLLEVLLRVAGA